MLRRFLRWFNPWYGCVAVIGVTAVALTAMAGVRWTVLDHFAGVEAAHYTPPPPSSAPLVAIVGDSYTAGSGQDSGAEALWAAILSTKLGFERQILAVGGSGWVTESPTASGSTFVEQAALIRSDASTVVFFGSRNDGGRGGEVRAAAAKAFAEVKAIAPKAKLIVIGPPWVDSSPPRWLLDDRGAVRSAARAAGAVWVDPVADDWFPTGNGMIGSDGVHPTDVGHKHMADLIEPVLKAALPKS